MQEARIKNGLRKSYHSMFYLLYVFNCAAENSSIFTGHKVVNSQPIVPTLCEVCFISSAANIIHRIKPAPGPKCGKFVAFAPEMGVCM